jgi:hypothetical protein
MGNHSWLLDPPQEAILSNSPQVDLRAALSAEAFSVFSTWSIPRHLRRRVAPYSPPFAT